MTLLRCRIFGHEVEPWGDRNMGARCIRFGCDYIRPAPVWPDPPPPKPRPAQVWSSQPSGERFVTLAFDRHELIRLTLALERSRGNDDAVADQVRDSELLERLQSAQQTLAKRGGA